VANVNAKEAILLAARQKAQAHGFNGLNFRDIAEEVGIKAASVYHHFQSKADLGAAVAQRYWQDTAAQMEAISEQVQDPLERLRRFPEFFRKSLANENRLCLGSFMSAEYDDLPDAVKREVQAFADVNVAWLAKNLTEARLVSEADSTARARTIFAAVAGAQLMARSRSDIALFDTLMDGYRSVGLLPG
jgi:TetR/AcrR family transcriptional repressor of nem operon